MFKWRFAKNFKTMLLKARFYHLSNFFKRNKKRSVTSLATSFSIISEIEIFLKQSLINWLNLIGWLPLLLKILSNMYVLSIFCPVCAITYCVIKVYFCIKTFFYITNNSGEKCKYLRRLNELVLWSSGLANCFVCKRFSVQIPWWSMEFAIQINLEHNTV